MEYASKRSGREGAHGPKDPCRDPACVVYRTACIVHACMTSPCDIELEFSRASHPSCGRHRTACIVPHRASGWQLSAMALRRTAEARAREAAAAEADSSADQDTDHDDDDDDDDDDDTGHPPAAREKERVHRAGKKQAQEGRLDIPVKATRRVSAPPVRCTLNVGRGIRVPLAAQCLTTGPTVTQGCGEAFGGTGRGSVPVPVSDGSYIRLYRATNRQIFSP
jgi:hypothetical protein